VGEAIAHGQSGLLFAPRDPDALASALLALLGDERLRTRLGQAARERQRTTFSKENMVRGVLRVYAEALGGDEPT
jgi:glycosyltransferase involved in cell wall biosynthesis